MKKMSKIASIVLIMMVLLTTTVMAADPARATDITPGSITRSTWFTKS